MVRDTYLLSLSKIIRALLSFFSVYVLSRFLSQAEYGGYRDILLLLNLLSTLLNLGIPKSVLYLGGRVEQKEQRSVVIASTGIIFLLIVAIAFLTFFIFNPFSFFIQNVKPIYFIIVYFMIVNSIWEHTIIVGKSTIAILASSIVYVLVVGLSLIALWLFPDSNPIEILELGLLFGEIVKSIVFLFYMRKLKLLGISFSTGEVRRLLSIGFPLWLTSLVDIGNVYADKIIVSSMFEDSVYAVFANGSQDVPIINIFIYSAHSVVLPKISRLISKGSLSAAWKLYRSIFLSLAKIIIPIFIFLFVFAESYVEFFFSAIYADSVGIFRVYAFKIVTRVFMMSTFMIGLSQRRFLLRLSIGLLVLNVLMNFILLELIGLSGPGISTIVVSVLAIAISILRTPVCRSTHFGKQDRSLINQLLRLVAYSAGIAIFLNIIFEELFLETVNLIVAGVVWLSVLVGLLYLFDRKNVKSIINLLKNGLIKG